MIYCPYLDSTQDLRSNIAVRLLECPQAEGYIWQYILHLVLIRIHYGVMEFGHNSVDTSVSTLQCPHYCVQTTVSTSQCGQSSILAAVSRRPQCPSVHGCSVPSRVHWPAGRSVRTESTQNWFTVDIYNTAVEWGQHDFFSLCCFF